MKTAFGITLRQAGWILLAGIHCSSTFAAEGASGPNVVLIYADDLGYGDLSCYGATRIRTPNLDRLAAEGLRFVNAHSASATCTPSRYAMLTGEYAWRRKGTGVLAGNAPLIIEPGRTTLPSVLRQAGYATGVVGKWHLGLGRPGMDWNGDLRPGPLEIGFDYAFLMPATGDRVPCVYVENHRVVGLDTNDPIQVSFRAPVGTEPTGKAHPERLTLHPSHGHDQTIVNGISRIGHMSGGKAARWVDEDMADRFTRQAVRFLEQHKDRRFFLYFATHDIHVPRVPHLRYAGRSGLGARGDVILELDGSVGEVLDTLERLGVASRTLVIFTSDNGPVLDDGYKDRAVELARGHQPSGPLRGGKYSAFEAGTRVPFLVRWPGRIKPGTSEALVCQVDFLATFAAMSRQPLARADAPDSVNILEALLGESPAGRNHLVEHAGTLSLVQGPWKYIEPSKGPRFNKNTAIELGNDPNPQLYNLSADLGERRNLAADQPDRVHAMATRLRQIRSDGRSRPE
ncbi:MAG: arylsulfatase [Verrucomicrobia bacterium]|nr:arylsulfatase [Verrucomicrobiota bacterium]